MTWNEMQFGGTPYIEADGQAGFTYGDTPLQSGDFVQIGVTVIINECREW